jgi:hypothetical protein
MIEPVRAESSTVGHVDYLCKLALYRDELTWGVIPEEKKHEGCNKKFGVWVANSLRVIDGLSRSSQRGLSGGRRSYSNI